MSEREGLELLLNVTKRSSGIKHNQSVFGSHKKKHPPEKDNYCGTNACIAGKLALSPEGKALGINSWWKEDGLGFFYLYIGPPGMKGKEDLITYKDICVYISRLIGVSEETLLFLFRPGPGGKRAAIQSIRMKIRELGED